MITLNLKYKLHYILPSFHLIIYSFHSIQVKSVLGYVVDYVCDNLP